jgi:hypothetical protein
MRPRDYCLIEGNISFHGHARDASAQSLSPEGSRSHQRAADGAIGVGPVVTQRCAGAVSVKATTSPVTKRRFGTECTPGKCRENYRSLAMSNCTVQSLQDDIAVEPLAGRSKLTTSSLPGRSAVSGKIPMTPVPATVTP